MADIRQWLDSLGLVRYADAFEEHEIDWDVLPQLDHQTLKDIGVASTGARLRILRAAEERSPERGEVRPASTMSSTHAAHSRHAPSPIGDAERRQLTVMFCDLVASTALSEELELERYREVLAAYQTQCAKAIARYDGYIARYMGDGLLVYFGYPRAHEDDAERAVRAGLAVVRAVASLDLLGDRTLAVRVGIATGLVVAGDIVGEGASEERAVLGDAPSLAARLQSIADPGAVLIADTTRQLAGRLFDYDDIGRHELKGFNQAVQVWRAVAELPSVTRFEATRSPERTVLVGRDSELMLLVERWDRAKANEGQVVLLSGEPGIGKSRLTHALRTRVESEGGDVIQLQCSPHHANSAFYPFIEHVLRDADIAASDTAEVKRDKLRSWLGNDDTEETGALLAALLAVPEATRDPFPALSPQQQKQRTMETLARRMLSGVERNPRLLIVEDLHWSDPTTLDVMSLVIDGIPGAPLLLVMTHRPEFVPSWQGRGHVTAHSLARLGRRQVSAIVESMAGGKALPEVLVDEVVTALLEAGFLKEETDRYRLAGPRLPVSVPATLKDSLVARLDRLADVKYVAQMASAIGREFSYLLLSELSPLDSTTLMGALEKLEAAELIFRRGSPPEATYTFKHALVQDAAYDSLLQGDRERLHARLSTLLESKFPDIVAQLPEVLARHYTLAGSLSKALEYWQRAADLALQRSAYHERLAHLDAALQALRGVDDPEQRRMREIGLQISRGGALMATAGYRALETGRAFARAYELAEDVDSRGAFAALRGLHGVRYARGELETALEAARACLTIGERGGDQEHVALAHRLVGQTLFIQGRLSQAQHHLENAFDARQSDESSAVAALTGGGHQLMAPVFLAQLLWVQGYPDRSLALAENALETAERRYGAFAVATNLFFLCWIHGWRGDYDALSERAERVRRLASEHEIFEWASPGGLLSDWTRLAGERSADAVALARRRLSAVRELGGVLTPFKLGLLADTIAQDDPSLALDIVDEALALSKRGERWSEAELHRVRGRALTDRDPSAAEECFSTALGVAREQGAKSWELRAATSLAGLHVANEEPARARSLLAPVYRWFTEGFQTADLHAARQLLETVE